MRGEGRFELQFDRRRLLQGGAPVALGSRAYDLLVALWERRTRVVGKAELLELVWPGLVVEENNLQVQIGHLRKVLGADAIATVPGRGYRLTGDVEPTAASPRPARGVDSHAAAPGASPAALLPQVLALIRDCEAASEGPIDLRALGEAIAACRRLVLIDARAADRTPGAGASRTQQLPLDIDDVRDALTATCAALELRIAARAVAASARPAYCPDGAPGEPSATPTGLRAGVQPPWE